MKTYTFQPHGVCSREMQVDLDDQNVIQEFRVVAGCHGNLQGIAALVKGMPAEEAIRRLKGINCKGKGTSCPDQLARGLEQALAQG
ncbi:TIGR03905 family TSCPD domain-containing protein [uncultured Oscillibacter sp.]|uniref:TIGR03905 family TSCPD domain-containing protein n=1 Tax=uncultured Oscillibacter sp. TaxID=876091 RepID=UPI0025EE4F1C|nr:TIGR03905 family TSCPD domain-containing protein [uncultured Oscillibacter sp.]